MRILYVLVAALGICVGRVADADEIIFKDAAGRVITRDELKKASGAYKWEVLGDRPVPEAAKTLHSQGADAGSKGD